MELPIATPQRRFAAPRWTTDSPEWQTLDRQLAADHKARVIDAIVRERDLGDLEDLYHGVGSKPHPPS